jgi:hypothetical protein
MTTKHDDSNARRSRNDATFRRIVGFGGRTTAAQNVLGGISGLQSFVGRLVVADRVFLDDVDDGGFGAVAAAVGRLRSYRVRRRQRSVESRRF